MSSVVEILLTTTAFKDSLGNEQGKIMAKAMSDHIDQSAAFKFREVRSGWGVCEGVSFHLINPESRMTRAWIEAYPLTCLLLNFL